MRRWFGWRGVVAALYALGLAIAAIPLAMHAVVGPAQGEHHPSPAQAARPVPTPAPATAPSPSAGGLSPAGAGADPRPAFAHVAYTTSDIPRTALAAYRSAASLIGRSDPSCHLEWSLLAAIGRVESGHGTYAGSTMNADGDVSPPIIGPVLDGSGATALVTDTDGGRLDGDTRFDRAVGPMQFLPGTWGVVGADGNGDGVDDPENVFDAAVSAGRHLCAGDVDLSDDSQLRAAVFRYNHSHSYVSRVLELAERYAHGTVAAMPAIPGTGTVQPPPPLHGQLPEATTGHPLGGAPSPHGSATSPSPEGTHDHVMADAPHSSGPSGSSPPADQGGGGETPGPDSSPPPQRGGSPGPPGGSSPGPGGGHGSTTPPPSPTPEPPTSEPPASPSPSPPELAVDPIGHDQGAVGTDVRVTGRGLEGASAFFDGAQAKPVSSADDLLVVEAPAHPTAGPVEVTVRRSDGQEAVVPGGFTYVPTLDDDITPSHGPVTGGTPVTLTGTSLKGATVGFDGHDVAPSSSSGTTLVVSSPVHAVGVVEITVSDGGWSETRRFTYQPVITDAPESASPGEAVTVEGEGIADGSSVTLTPTDEDGNEVTDEAITFEGDTLDHPDAESLGFTLPDELDSGVYLIRVITLGVPSEPAMLEVSRA